MEDDEWFYFDKDNVKRGPVPMMLMEGLWESGEVDGMTLVTREGWPAARMVSEVLELRSQFERAASSDDEDEGEEEEEEVQGGGGGHGGGGDAAGGNGRNSGGSAAKGDANEILAHTATHEHVPHHEVSWEEQWQSTQSDGRTYYYNKLTLETAWELAPPATKPPAPLPPLWQACYTASGMLYYLHMITKQSSYDFPGTPSSGSTASGAGSASQAAGPSKSTAAKRKAPDAPSAAVADGPAPVGDGAGGGSRVDADAPGGAASGDGTQPAAAETKKKKKKTGKPKWLKEKERTTVFIQGLPLDVTLDEVVEFASKCGKIREEIDPPYKPIVKLYATEDGRPTGEARVSYLKEPSVDNALTLLDGSAFRPTDAQVVSVTRAVFQRHQGDDQKKEVKDKKKALAAARKARLMRQQQESSLSWAEGACEDPRGIRIVVLQPMFTLEEMQSDPDFKGVLEVDIKLECEKMGEVEKVTVFPTSPLGVVLVKFKSVATCEVCIERMHGRFFGGQQITAAMWDGVTNYKPPAGATVVDEEEEKRLDAFGNWLEAQPDVPSDDEAPGAGQQ